MRRILCLTALALTAGALAGCAPLNIMHPDGSFPAAETGSSIAEETTEMTGAESTAAETTAPAPTEAQTETLPAESTEASSPDAWKAAYREILTDYRESAGEIDDDINSIGWDLQDLDNDGTPELLISEGLFHVAGVLYYYFEDGTAKQLMDDSGEPLRYGIYGETLICPEEQLFGVANIHMGYTYEAMHRYEDHKLTQLLSIMEDSGAVGEENVTYTVNDEATDKETYDAVLSEFNSRNWTVAGRKYGFDDFSALESETVPDP